jgi:energy-coupling factor transport system permease protein
MPGPDRPVHPGGWWCWALGLAATATRTTNLILLGLVLAVVFTVAWACRTPSPLAGAHLLFLRIALVVIVLRLALQIVFAPRLPGTVLFELPSVELPSWAAGVSVGGPVTAESLVGGLRFGLQLAVILVSVGAANALTSPARLLRSLPAVLYEAGVAVTVALSATPQAIVAVQRLREARLLRGRPTRGPAALRGFAVPVLDGALGRSLTLAASMDARGFGRRAVRARGQWSVVLLLVGVVALGVAAYGLLAPGPGRSLAGPALGVGALGCGSSLMLASRGDRRTRYRPVPWDRRAWLIVAAGAAPFVATFLVSDPDALHPPVSPLTVPALPWVMTAGLLVAFLPVLVAPTRGEAP